MDACRCGASRYCGFCFRWSLSLHFPTDIGHIGYAVGHEVLKSAGKWMANTRSRVCSSTCTRGGDGEEGGSVKPATRKSALRQPPPPLAALAMRNARVVIYLRQPVLVLNRLLRLDSSDYCAYTFFPLQYKHHLQNGRRLCSRHRVST